jgi:hypothetical protein
MKPMDRFTKDDLKMAGWNWAERLDDRTTEDGLYEMKVKGSFQGKKMIKWVRRGADYRTWTMSPTQD